MQARFSANNLCTCAALAVLCCCPALAQVARVVNLADGPAKVVLKYHLPVGVRSARTSSVGRVAALPGEVPSDKGEGLAFFTAHFTSLAGKRLPMHIVGSNPARGADTTTIPTVLIPIKFIFANAGNPTLDGANVVEAFQSSPIFQTADYTSGPVDLGVTQYGDALQRAEFWNLPGFSQRYHVLLGQPLIAPTITVTVPAALGNAYPLSGGGYLGVVDDTFLYTLVTNAGAAYGASQLPIVVTDNVYSGAGGLIQNCCVLGFHASEDAPIASARTWIFSGYAEPGTFGTGLEGFGDVIVLSHEVGEWLNDPFPSVFADTNWVPPAVLPDSGGACIPNFETADPLERPYTFTKVTNSTTYHLVDQVFLPWYLHTTPSFSVNGWYTFQNLSGVQPLVVNSPASVAGTYDDTSTLSFAPVGNGVAGSVAYVGRGCPAGSITASNPDDPYLANPAGQIALIDRGACPVSLKIDRAARAGATGVLIDLVAPGDALSFTFSGGSDFVPSLVITQSTGNAIKGALGSSPVDISISPDRRIPATFSSLCGPA